MIGLLLTYGDTLHAAAIADMVFSGTLNIAPACTINHGQKVEVDFGTGVGVNKVNGQDNLRTIGYNVTCEPGGHGMALWLTLSGPVSSFDKHALQTNIADLAIRILRDGEPLELNKRINIAITNPPVLQAVPVKRASVELKSGAFSVTATLLADYL
ncbi:TPA: fimbrial protein [Serratia marcescens]|nr:fimbrial protein [Serratia marcescens]